MLTYSNGLYVCFPATGFLVSLSNIYDWTRERGFKANQEHIIMHGVPVQFLSAKDGLEEEAVKAARTVDYDGVPVRVMAPEYLVAIYQLIGGEKRRGRARTLFDAKTINSEKLQGIIQRFNLEIPQGNEGISDGEN